ncbi:FG-GAP-like repeat-containing protein [Streptomyces sp. NBC_00083]|uniref:FG-GAP-like repeat-containing protein n=1 Tax=Streptomyces sp. NBC_00083 TaxID=2975647 RepID=UPI0022536B04|nr:FG-GAP-like repeat-containing protein [Streptomyces sp. NBC_00083]MCX5382582.1 FG-GAP-like repeat-containing protein [Streptomyces sp. NBC_00083]
MPRTEQNSRPRRGKAALTALAFTGVAAGALSLAGAGPAGAASVATWDKLAQCESSGNWSVVDPTHHFYGGIQFDLQTWNAYGGRQYATYPNQATKKEQILIGEKLLAARGAAPWPTCGGPSGIANDHADPYPAEPPAPVGVVKLTAADFNGDGTKDIVGVEAATGKLWLYPGNGNGTLGGRIQIGSGWDGMSNLAAADYTGDGKADLVAVDNATGRLFVYPGSGAAAGMNTLGDRVQIGTGWNSLRDLTALDVTKDNKPDLLGIDNNGALWAYPGNGDGALGARVQIGSGWDTMAELSSPGDLNGDGKGDLVAVDQGGKLWNYPGTGALNGTGTLGARTQIGTGWNAMHQLVGADFNGDGKGDLDAVQAPTGATGAFYFYPGNGSGGLADRAQIGTGW